MTHQTSDQMKLALRRLVALQLWRMGAVTFNLESPFKLASGNYSPIHVNCRLLISSPLFADIFGAASRMLIEDAGVPFDVLAGGETAGIPLAAMLSRTFGRPMIYVRKNAKDHGLRRIIEGLLPAGARVLLVEDLITNASTKLRFIEAIQTAGGNVVGVLVVFDRCQGGADSLAASGIPLLSTTDIQSVLQAGLDAGVLEPEQMAAVDPYVRSPQAWHEDRKLRFRP
jgi:orotate phosphoribosyltransferase